MMQNSLSKGPRSREIGLLEMKMRLAEEEIKEFER
jgi:hypothetical protein